MDGQPLGNNEAKWRIHKRDVQWASRLARTTTPGTDGISSAMWGKLGTATKLLYEVGMDMEHRDFPKKLEEA